MLAFFFLILVHVSASNAGDAGENKNNVSSEQGLLVGCLPAFLPLDSLENVIATANEVFDLQEKKPAFHLDQVPDGKSIVFMDSNIAFHLIGFLKRRESLEPALKDGFKYLEFWLHQLNSESEQKNSLRFAVTPQVLRELKRHGMMRTSHGNVAATEEPTEELKENTFHKLYEDTIDHFFEMGLGVRSGIPRFQLDGIKDRRIITQLMFSTHNLNQPLRFVTRDEGVYMALFRMGLMNGSLKSRLNLKDELDGFPSLLELESSLRGSFLREIRKEIVHLLYPEGFTVQIQVGEFTRTLQVLAIPGAERARQIARINFRNIWMKEFRARHPLIFQNWVKAYWKKANQPGRKVEIQWIGDTGPLGTPVDAASNNSSNKMLKVVEEADLGKIESIRISL